MSASEDVRRMLDVRGIPHEDIQTNYSTRTLWKPGGDGPISIGDGYLSFEEDPDGFCMLILVDATPEQAIAATIGGYCPTCPQTEDPDSFIRYLLKVIEIYEDRRLQDDGT